MGRKTLRDWLRDNPPPDAQKLAEQYGGLSRIPVKKWQEFDRAQRKWQKQRLAQARREVQ
jgi:hypothetical protein